MKTKTRSSTRTMVTVGLVALLAAAAAAGAVSFKNRSGNEGRSYPSFGTPGYTTPGYLPPAGYVTPILNPVSPANLKSMINRWLN
ncbi:MAG: hypothetical protein AAB570_03195 [Patescibacteria group bacterium]